MERLISFKYSGSLQKFAGSGIVVTEKNTLHFITL